MNPTADWDAIVVLAAEILLYRAKRAAAESETDSVAEAA
jgi:hypothetical protein